MLKYLMGDLKIYYDIICGVSAGAINAAFLGQFPQSLEKESIEELESLWLELTSDKIYKRWAPFGRLHGLWQKGFWDSSPMINLINNKLSHKQLLSSGKIISVGAVSLTRGKYIHFDQNDPDFLSAVAASASFPGAFPPIKFKNQLWIDGGVKQITPLKIAIDLGAVKIDVVSTSPIDRDPNFHENPSLSSIIVRCIDLMSDKITTNDLEKAVNYNLLAQNNLIEGKKFVNFNIIRPEKNLTYNIFNFDKDLIKDMIDTGYNKAKSLNLNT